MLEGRDAGVSHRHSSAVELRFLWDLTDGNLGDPETQRIAHKALVSELRTDLSSPASCLGSVLILWHIHCFILFVMTFQ